MSKERARRRAEREREAAVRAAARAAEQERRERRAARKRALTRHLPRCRPRPVGILEQRRRHRTTFVVCLLVALNLLLWFVSDHWAVRLGALVVSVLAAPVLFVLLFPRP